MGHTYTIRLIREDDGDCLDSKGYTGLTVKEIKFIERWLKGLTFKVDTVYAKNVKDGKLTWTDVFMPEVYGPQELLSKHKHKKGTGKMVCVTPEFFDKKGNWIATDKMVEDYIKGK